MEKELTTPCDMCIHCSFDEDDVMECETELDEDEFLTYFGKKNPGCPYFQLNDEYKRVRTQN